MKVYTVKAGSHFKHLWSSIFITILLPVIVYFLSIYKKGYFDFNAAIWAGSIGFFGYFIPILSIHLNYYFRDRHNSFEFNRSSGEINYCKGDDTVSFNEGDIQKITVTKSRPLAEGRTLILPWDEYHYAVIELKDGQVLKISSLLVYELDKVVKFENTEVKKPFYAWMS